MSKKPAKNNVPVDGAAVNSGWTIENGQYARRYGRNKIATENGIKAAKKRREQKKPTVKVEATF